MYKTSELIQANCLEIGDGYRAKNSELGGKGLPFVRASNVNNGFDLSITDRFLHENLKRVGKKVSMVGDSVYTTKGTVGRAAYVKENTRKMVYSPQLSYWRSLDYSVLWPRYLFYWIQGPEFSLQANSIKGQTDMADYVSLTEQRRMQITVPPLPEQKAIASILGSLDDKIELNNKMNETLETIASALYKSWFIDFDPVVAKAAGKRPFGMDDETAALFPDTFVDSELGPIPEGWDTRTVEDIAKTTSGKRPEKREKEPSPSNQIPVIGGGGITAYTDRSLFQYPFLITGRVGTLGNVFRIQSPVWPSDNTICIFPNKKEHLEIAYYAIEDMDLVVLNRGSTQPLLSQSDLKIQKVIHPQDTISKVFSKIISEYWKIEQVNDDESQTLSQLRDLLLPKLISGEIRIKDAEKVVEEVL